MASIDNIGKTMGRYLLAINWLTAGTDDRVRTGQLQEYLDISPASATEMLTRLDDRSLVAHESYRGAALTKDGASLADVLAWRHCVVANFFASVLEVDLDEETAYEIGFELPSEGIRRLGDLIEHPCTDECQDTEQDYDGCLIGA